MIELLQRAWDTLDTFKQAYPENWHDGDEQVMDDLLQASVQLSQAKRSRVERENVKSSKDYIDGWNDALDEAAGRIASIRGFEQATQDSFAVYIKELKK